MKLSEEDRLEILKLYRDAETTPVITMAVDQPSFAESAWKRVREKMQELGEKYGFDPEKMKGIDPETGEILL